MAAQHCQSHGHSQPSAIVVYELCSNLPMYVAQLRLGCARLEGESIASNAHGLAYVSHGSVGIHAAISWA